MPTFETVLKTASGLYEDQRSGEGYVREELLLSLGRDALDSGVRLHRLDRGTYILTLKSHGDRAFKLLSRRRVPRVMANERNERLAAVDSPQQRTGRV